MFLAAKDVAPPRKLARVDCNAEENVARRGIAGFAFSGGGTITGAFPRLETSSERPTSFTGFCRGGASIFGAICGAGMCAARQVLAANACVARDHSRLEKASRKTGFHANPLG